MKKQNLSSSDKSIVDANIMGKIRAKKITRWLSFITIIIGGSVLTYLFIVKKYYGFSIVIFVTILLSIGILVKFIQKEKE